MLIFLMLALCFYISACIVMTIDVITDISYYGIECMTNGKIISCIIFLPGTIIGFSIYSIYLFYEKIYEDSKLHEWMNRSPFKKY